MNLQLIEKILELCPTIYRSKFDDFIDVRCIFECDDRWGTFLYTHSLLLEKIALAELEAGVPIDEVTKGHKFEHKHKILFTYIETLNPTVRHIIENFERQRFNACTTCGEFFITEKVDSTQQLLCSRCNKITPLTK